MISCTLTTSHCTSDSKPVMQWNFNCMGIFGTPILLLCLHSHLMYGMPPCQSVASGHPVFNRIQFSHSDLWHMTECPSQVPALGRLAPCQIASAWMLIFFPCSGKWLEVLPTLNIRNEDVIHTKMQKEPGETNEETYKCARLKWAQLHDS